VGEGEKGTDAIKSNKQNRKSCNVLENKEKSNIGCPKNICRNFKNTCNMTNLPLNQNYIKRRRI